MTIIERPQGEVADAHVSGRNQRPPAVRSVSAMESDKFAFRAARYLLDCGLTATEAAEALHEELGLGIADSRDIVTSHRWH